MDSITIPIIQKMIPLSIAETIIGVQPMQDSVGEIFKCNRISWVMNCYGDIIHNFLYGWMWYSGEGTGHLGNGWTPIDGPICHVKYENEIERPRPYVLEDNE